MSQPLTLANSQLGKNVTMLIRSESLIGTPVTGVSETTTHNSSCYNLLQNQSFLTRDIMPTSFTAFSPQL